MAIKYHYITGVLITLTITKDILLQFFFALLPFLLFNVYYRDKVQNFSKKFIIATSTIALFLAMNFPLSIGDGYNFDGRHIIMFFGIIFGGLQTGAILLVEFVCFRFYQGGEGKWIGTLIFICTFLISILFKEIYKRSRRKSFVIFIAAVVFSIHPLLFLYHYDSNYVLDNLIVHTFAIPLFYLIGIWMLISLFNKAVSDKTLFIKYTQNEKFEAMSHVAVSLAHEVRNPLTAVKGFLKLIGQYSVDKSKIEEYITISLEEIKRTEIILSDYLAISRPPSKQKEAIDLSHQVVAVVDVMKPYANMCNVQIEVQKQLIPSTIIANVDEIKQLLVNIVKNAIEACADVSNAKVSLSLRQENNNVILIIKDNGIGMDKNQLSRLGSIYYTTKSNGTGIGLTFSFNVVRALGGTISAQSEPQMGTSFFISLPLYDFISDN